MGSQLAECDQQIEGQLTVLRRHEGAPAARAKKRGRARNAPRFDLRTQLFRMCGVDLTRIDGVDVTTALAVVSEIGPDLSRRACVIVPTPIHRTVSAVLTPACRGEGTVASVIEARMRVMKAAAVQIPFSVYSRKARRKALMRPASTARMSQRRLKPAAASTALSASPVAPFNQQRAIR